MSKDQRFKLQISIRRSDDDSPVFQKQDGERFASPTTVKLNVGTKYTLLFTTKPAMCIRKVVLREETLTLEDQKPEKSDDSKRVYHTDWSTEGIEVNKGNSRTVVKFMIEMDGGMVISPQIQAKFYPASELSHSKWGTEFHLLDVECHRKEGSISVEIEEKYI